MNATKLRLRSCRNGTVLVLFSLVAPHVHAQAPASATGPTSNVEATNSTDNGEVVALPAFDVNDDAGKKGYHSTLIGGANRMVVPIDEMDGSAFVINQQLIEDTQPHYLADVAKYVAGVEQPRFYSPWDDLVIRGSGTATNFVDGMPVSGLDYVPVDLVDQFEVIKGSQGVLYGSVQGDGVINRVMKQPKFTSGGDIQAMVGTYGYLHAVADIYGPLADTHNALAYRFINVWSEGGGRQVNMGTKFPENDHYGALTWALPGGGSITANFQFDDRQWTPATEVDGGDPVTGLFDPNYNKTYSYYVSDVTNQRDISGRVTAEKRLGPVQNRLSYQYLYAHWNDTALFPCCSNSAAPGIEPIYARYRDNVFDVRTLDDDGVVKFNFGDLAANIVNFGYIYEVTNSWSEQLQDYPPNADYGYANRYNMPRNPPQYNTLSPNSVLASDNSAVDQTSSGYANWRLSLFKDRLSLVAGMRYEYYNEVLSNLKAGNSLPAKQGTAKLYRYGIVGKILPGLNAYVGYGETFNINTSLGYIPPGSVVQSSNYLPNQSRKSTEGGLHITFWDQKLAIQAAYYSIKATGNTSGGSSSFIPIILLPDNTNTGFELQLTATPTENWVFIGSLTAAKVNDANGQRTQDFSNNLANFWTKYTFTDGAAKGLGVGVGVSYYGDKRPGAQPSGTGGTMTNWMIPAVTVADASISYKWSEHWSSHLNADNLFDKLYVTRFDGLLAVWFNNGRKVTFSTDYKW